MRALMRFQVGTFSVHLIAPRCITSVDLSVFGRPTFARLTTVPTQVRRWPRRQGEIDPLRLDPIRAGAVRLRFQKGSTGGHRSGSCRRTGDHSRRRLGRLQQAVKCGGRRGRLTQRVVFGQAGCETSYRCRQRVWRYQLGT